MARIYSVSVPNALHDAVEEDRRAMSMQTGTDLSMSQYLRIVLSARVQLADPIPVGVGEGMRRGFAKLMARMQEVVVEIAAEEEAEAAAAG